MVAGLTLIVLSFLVGRTPAAKEEAGDTDAGPFIDQPLSSTFGEQPAEERRIKPVPLPEEVGEEEEPTEEVPIIPSVAGPVAAPVPGAALSPAPAPIPDLVSAAEVGRAVASGEGPAGNERDFDFRVLLGFKFLGLSMHREAAAEFQKAVALTDDKETKLKLFVEIGNAFRRNGMHQQAMAAYLQAEAYTDNPQLTEHLERSISEMAQASSQASSTQPSGSE
ncbi:MAG: hypothetical protein Kow00129_11610 [Thermoleophilia bacterium]